MLWLLLLPISWLVFLSTVWDWWHPWQNVQSRPLATVLAAVWYPLFLFGLFTFGWVAMGMLWMGVIRPVIRMLKSDPKWTLGDGEM